MCMLVPLLIKYSRLVEVVDAHLPRGVNDALIAYDNAHMRDGAAVFTEEGEVAGLRLGQEIHQLAAFNLLGGIAGEKQSRKAGAHLHQA